MVVLTDAEVTAKVDADHWRVVLGGLHACFRTDSFAAGLSFVARVADVAERLEHHPDVDLHWSTVHLTVVSHDVGRLTDRDVLLANRVSAVARELGLDADPAAPQVFEIAVDALDIAAVVPFWRAVLNYDDERPPAEDASPALVDPRGRGPSVWFQQMDAPRPQRNRIHVDLSVPHDVAEERVEAAVAAGGRVVRDDHAPAFWVLADPEGNEVCVSTWRGRD